MFFTAQNRKINIKTCHSFPAYLNSTKRKEERGEEKRGGEEGKGRGKGDEEGAGLNSRYALGEEKG